MRKIVLSLLILLMAVPALAEAPRSEPRSGLFIGTKVGVMRTQMKLDRERKDDVVFPFAVSLGLRLRQFRVEAEYTFATKAKRDKYEQQTDTMLGQLYYDVLFRAPLHPYLNVGIGRHNTKVKEKNVFKEERKGWAWNVGAGMTWNVSNAVNIDFGYRYLDIGDLKTANGTIKTRHHFVFLGWRYVF